MIIYSGAQAAVIEGKNSITMTNCNYTANSVNNGVMLYQSMFGDAADKDATSNCSMLTMSGTTIRNNTAVAMFYVTNTISAINLDRGKTIEYSNGCLDNAVAGRWG